MSTRKLVLISALSMASGACWGLIALGLMDYVFSIPDYARGGLIASPLIGLAMGFASARFPSDYPPGRLLFSLISLYAAAVLFGFCMGVFDLVFGQNSGPGWRRYPHAVVIEPIVAVLWGLTLMGFFIVLWPLSYANHAMMARMWNRQ